MELPIKKGWAITIGIVLLLALLNPTPTDFKNYKGEKSYYSFRRPLNFVLLSVYNDNGVNYLAFLKNFISLKENQSSTHLATDSTKTTVDTTRVVLSDTTKMAADTTAYQLPVPTYEEVMSSPDINKSYNALKKIFPDFNKTREEFGTLIINNKSYRHRVYKALKENVDGFYYTEKQFDNKITPTTVEGLPIIKSNPNDPLGILSTTHKKQKNNNYTSVDNLPDLNK